MALWRVRLSGEVTLELDKAYVQPLAVQQAPGEGYWSWARLMFSEFKF